MTFSVSGRLHRKVNRLQIGRAGPPASGIKMSCSADPNDFVDSRFRTAGSIKVGRNGVFKDRFNTQGSISYGTLRITGRFRTGAKASARVHWTITRTDDGRTCDSGTVTFTATKR